MPMLQGNLASRPFYNERLVTLGLVLIAVIAVAASVFNARRLLDLSHERSVLEARIDGNKRQADEIRHEAQQTQRTVDRSHLQTLVAQTREANQLIDQRTFSWTTLFGLIEKTLPLDVRLVAVSPKIDKDSTLITMIVVSRRDEALSEFVTALEGSAGMGTFYDVLPHADNRNDDGTYGATIEAYYLPPVAPTAPTVPTVTSGRAAGAADPKTAGTAAPGAVAPSGGRSGRQ